jgi:FMN phosphatase YigB (HAD superfamily)
MNKNLEKIEKWIGFDFDGTLVTYNKARKYDPANVGTPIYSMVDLLKEYLAKNWKVKIFTARADENDPNHEKAIEALEAWCIKYIGQKLEITNKKDYALIKFYDDRAIQVEMNTGRIIKDA